MGRDHGKVENWRKEGRDYNRKRGDNCMTVVVLQVVTVQADICVKHFVLHQDSTIKETNIS